MLQQGSPSQIILDHKNLVKLMRMSSGKEIKVQILQIHISYWHRH